MKTIKRSVAIELCDLMIERYKKSLQKMEISFVCPICSHFKSITDSEYCKNCFNRPIKSENITAPCIDFKTIFHDEYRLLYWNEVSKYLHILTLEDVFIGQLRHKCIKIDNCLI